MTLSQEHYRSGPYAGTGLTTTFAYRFRVDDKRHLRVVRIQADGAESTLELDSEYLVTGVGKDHGGTVVLTAALASGEQLVIVRDQPLTQEMDLENQGPFFAEDVERAFDHAVMRDQELAERLSRAVTVPLGDSGDPKDYLAQMQALVNQALVSIEGQSEVSVLTHGAKGDRETNDITAFQAARDRAIELGLDYVVIPIPPDPADWYFLLGDIEGVADVEWRMDPRAAVNGSTNLFAVQSKWTGATVWEGPLDEVEVLPVDANRLTHQTQVGVDLDGEWIISYQTNETSPLEGADQQFVAYHRSTDGGQGLIWSSRIDFATSAAVCSNPLPMTAATEGGKFTLWQTGIINFQQPGFGSKLWIRFGHGRFSGTGGFTVAQKTTPDGIHTLYDFHMLADGTIRPIRYGDAVPAGATFNAWTHEGEGALFPICHDTYFSSSGRLHFLMVLLPNSGSAKTVPRHVCVMYCDNPGAGIDDMVFKLGPSIDIGVMDPANFWEWSMSEEAPGHFVAIMRRNETFGFVTPQEGQRHFIAFGDGVNFTGWKPAGLHAHRDRPSLIRLNNEHMAYVTHDEPTSRGNPALWIKARGGGFAPALPLGDFAPLDVHRASTRKASAKDTLLQAIDTTNDTVIGFTDASVQVEHNASAGEESDLAFEGFIPDWPDSTLDLAHVEVSAGDKVVVEVSGLEETFFVDGGANTSFVAEGDLTAGAPDVFAYGAGQETALTIGSGGVLIATATDGIEVQASATDINHIVLHQTGNKGTVTLATGQSLIDVTASLGFALAEDWTDVTLIEGESDSSFAVPELDAILSTANAKIDVIKNTSASDVFRWRIRKGNQLHVPTGNRHPETGDFLAAVAVQPVTAKGPGGKGLHASILRAENFPRTDQLVFIPRKSAQIEDADAGHTWTWTAETGILELVGKTSAGAALKPGRWQVSGKLRLSALPSKDDNARILQVGNFEEIVSLEAAWRDPYLVRDLHKILRSGGARDSARGRPINRKIFAAVEKSGEDYSIDGEAWVGFTFMYDSDRGEITIEGETIALQWPFVLTVGDGYLLSDAPTDRSLSLDVASVELQALPEDHRQWSRGRAKPDAPNLVLNTGLAIERERDGGRFAIQEPRALLPGWSIRARGGCSVNPSQGKNSQSAANQEFGGWLYNFSVSISDAVRSPATAATGPVVFDLAWTGIGAIPSGTYMLQLDIQDTLEAGSQNGARDDGLPLVLYWFQDYGERAKKGRRYYPIYPLRVPRWQRSFAIPIPVPAVALPSRGVIVEPDSSCGFEFRVQEGYNCNLVLRNLDFFKGDEPRDWAPPSPYAFDETQRVFHQVPAPKIGAAVAQGLAINASQGDFLFALPDMIRAPYLGEEGEWAMDDLSAQHTGQLSLVEASERLARVRCQKTGGAMVTGSPLLLRGLSPKTFEQTGDGSARIFTADNLFIEDEDDIAAVYKRDSAGSTIDLTFGESVALKPSLEKAWDQIPAVSGQSSFTPDISLPKNMTAIDLLEFNAASGESLLELGSGGWTMGSTAVDGVGSITLLAAGGTARNMVSGNDYEVQLNQRLTAPHLILDTALPDTGALVVEHAEDGGSRLWFDARLGRPVWDYHPATDALYSAIAAPPDVKDGRYLKHDQELTIRDLDAAGIWDLLDVLYVFAAHDEPTALVNWKNPAAFAATATNAPTFLAGRGYATDGLTSYIDTGWAPASDAVNFTQDSASLFIYLYSLDSSVGNGTVAGASGGGVVLRIRPDDGASQSNYRMNDGTNANGSVLVPGSVGYNAIDRAGASSFEAYAMGAKGHLRSASLTRSSSGLSSAALFAGAGAGSYGKAEIAFFGAGASLTKAKHRALARILEDHLSRIGAL